MHSLVEKVTAESWKLAILDQVIFSQTEETCSVGKTLRYQEPGCDGELVLLSGWPAVNVLQQGRKRRLFKRFLKIFVSDYVDKLV